MSVEEEGSVDAEREESRSPDDASAAKSVADSPEDAADSSSQDGGSTSTLPVWLVGISLAALCASLLQIGLKATDHGFFVETLFVFICAAAALIDFAEQRIPNVLTYPAILLGLFLNLALAPALLRVGAEPAVVWLGAVGFRDAMLGFGLCALFGIVSFMCRGLGGGDVKLLGAAGAFLGLRAVVPTLFNWLVVAALFGLINWAFKGSLVARLQVVCQNMLGFLFTRKGFRHIYPFDKTVIPFGVFLLAGWALYKTPFSPHRWVLPTW